MWWSREERLTPGWMSSSGFVFLFLSEVSLNTKVHNVNHSQNVILLLDREVFKYKYSTQSCSHSCCVMYVFSNWLTSFCLSDHSSFVLAFIKHKPLPPQPHPLVITERIIAVAAQWGEERMSSPLSSQRLETVHYHSPGHRVHSVASSLSFTLSHKLPLWVTICIQVWFLKGAFLYIVS